MNPDIPFELEEPVALKESQFTEGKSTEDTQTRVSTNNNDHIDFRNLHPKKFIISQSDLKMVLRKGEEISHCPLQFIELKIFRRFEVPETLSMLKGSYFETLCLGRGSGGKIINDLPRKAISEKKALELAAAGIDSANILGEKTIDQLRIEQQAMRFLQRVEELKMVVHEKNTQIPILKEFGDNVYLSGVLDIFPTTMLTTEGLRWVVVDLKLTSDVNNRWGDYCWGAPEFMDHTQGHMYLELIEHIDPVLNPHLKPLMESLPDAFRKADLGEFVFHYWVWGYKKEPMHLQEKCNIRVQYGPTERAELRESIRKYVAMVEHYLSMESIPTNPGYELCKTCPVSDCNGGYCKDRVLTQLV